MSARIIVLIYIVLALSAFPGTAAERTPLVVVPGFMGSKLCEADTGKVVWPSLRHQRLRLPLKNKDSIANEKLVPCGIVDSIFKFLSWRIFDQYGQLSTYFQSELGYKRCETSRNGQPQQCNYLEFDYDWRRSSRDNAKILRQKIQRHFPTSPQVDILAHSLGGIVSRAYIKLVNDDSGGAEPKLRRFVTLGTPHLGSLDVFESLFEGVTNEKGLALGVEIISRLTEFESGTSSLRRTLLSFPSFYEMLPDYEQLGGVRAEIHCCYWQSRREPSLRDFNPFDVSAWEKFAWYSDIFTSPAEKDYLKSKLADALEFRKTVMRIPLPAYLETDVRLVANGVVDTRTRVVVDDETGELSRFIFRSGDGTVPLTSAIMGRRVESLGVYASDKQHSKLFTSDVTKQHLQRFFVGGDAPVAGSLGGFSECVKTSTGDGHDVATCRISWDVTPSYVLSGQSAEFFICISGQLGDKDFLTADFTNIKVQLLGLNNSSQNLALRRRNTSKSCNHLMGSSYPYQIYSVVFKPQIEPITRYGNGSWEIAISIPSRGSHSDILMLIAD